MLTKRDLELMDIARDQIVAAMSSIIQSSGMDGKYKDLVIRRLTQFGFDGKVITRYVDDAIAQVRKQNEPKRKRDEAAVSARKEMKRPAASPFDRSPTASGQNGTGEDQSSKPTNACVVPRKTK